MDSTRPALRLFVFHHAGGSHLLYRHWPARLPDTWDVRLLDAPGRGRLLDLPQIADAGRLAEFFLRRLEPELTVPYAFFGHSMGGLMAYEITRRLAARGCPLPVWVGVSGRGAPRLRAADEPRHERSDTELQTHLELLGGTPDEVFDNPELWARFAPVIRADLHLVESWCPEPGTVPLPVALSAYGGSEDHFVPPRLMTGWEEQTEHFLGLRVFDGGHFYFQDDPDPLLRQIEQDVTVALDASGAVRSS
ncbi:alpha/beta fold hydrolase (plasmid) [Streptomyces sp. NBC_01387]|uniref:thioesterase II family protein n=1 Tax=unclassified Streptomyces TaxID=2593676 RepID=UPI0020251019|nr:MULTISPECIES: alpha/beta fold hydrolase [unclassified Streptomyces]MCX4554447.1 alpha/beta fold hydrolase [Streptomyces sp. NBC_01500]WSC25169.1 alpha/beta fold hydrolase [Streptomyces sp. NBC_01766]WSV58949.1 alpha/beta fold hydrolase [Streptomyces sp. NBC_01014]